MGNITTGVTDNAKDMTGVAQIPGTGGGFGVHTVNLTGHGKGQSGDMVCLGAINPATSYPPARKQTNPIPVAKQVSRVNLLYFNSRLQ